MAGKGKNGFFYLRVLCWVGAIYLLSIGPAYGLVLRGVLPAPAAHTFYSPIWLLTSRISAADDLAWRWIDVFTPRTTLHDFEPLQPVKE